MCSCTHTKNMSSRGVEIQQKAQWMSYCLQSTINFRYLDYAHPTFTFWLTISNSRWLNRHMTLVSSNLPGIRFTIAAVFPERVATVPLCSPVCHIILRNIRIQIPATKGTWRGTALYPKRCNCNKLQQRAARPGAAPDLPIRWRV